MSGSPDDGHRGRPQAQQPLSQHVLGWERTATRTPPVIGVFPGEGIGPEVIDAALVVLDAVAHTTGLRFDRRWSDHSATDGQPQLTAEVVDFFESVFAAGGAVLCGAIGGRFVYDLRRRFDLYCKLVPLRPSPALADVAIVRPERLGGVDLLIVRENTGGLYFGDFGWREDGRVAYQNISYHADEVTRIVDVAARLARARRGRLTAVVKAGGVPAVSVLWRERTEAVAASHGIHVELLDVDNASFQIVADPCRFDVIVAPNLFGDVLADVATVLLGSRGMSYSANVGAGGCAVYQTGHGAAHDLAGSDRANPAAQILSLAMMLRESFGLTEAAWQIETAVESVFAADLRTADVARAGQRIVGSRELARCIALELSSLSERERASA